MEKMLSKEEIEKDIQYIKEVVALAKMIPDVRVQEAEINSLINILQYTEQLEQENNKLNKIIDEMAEYIVELIKFNNWEELREVEEVKQYFEKKVEEKNEL